MPLTTSTITGRVPLPTDAAPSSASLLFTLSKFDTEGADLVPPASVRVRLEADGSIPAGFRLWRNTAGSRGTHYVVSVSWKESGPGERPSGGEATLGRIQFGDQATYTLAELRNQIIPNVPQVGWFQAASASEVEQVKAAAVALEGYTAPGYLTTVTDAADRADQAAADADAFAERAELAASNAAANADVYPDIATGRAAVADGAQFQVEAGGEYIRYRRDSASTQTEVGRFPSAAAVAAEVEARSQLISNDDRSNDGIGVAIVGPNGERCWLEARIDPLLPGGNGGGPTEVALELIRQGLSALGLYHVHEDDNPGMTGYSLYIEGPADGAGRVPISPDFALDDSLRYREQELRSLFQRAADLGIAAPSGGGSSNAIEILPDGTVRTGTDDPAPAEVDTTKWAGWGSSSMNAMRTAMAALAPEFGATFYNGGRGGETGDEILARMGVAPYVLQAFNLPATTDAVLVTASNHWGFSTPAALTGYLDMPTPIRGTLSYDAGAVCRTFTRETAGAAVSIPAGTRFVSDLAQQQRDAVAFLNIAKNSVTSTSTAEELADYNLRAWRWCAGLFKRVIVVGQFPNTSHTPGTSQFDAIAEWNAIDAERYGKFFVPVMPWLTSGQAFTDLGLTPTSDDLTYMAEGRVPPSLMADSQHLSSAAYTAAVNNLIRPKLISLGWYPGVTS